MHVVTSWKLKGYNGRELYDLPLGIYNVVTEKACMQMTLIIVGYSELWGNAAFYIYAFLRY